MGRPRKVSVTLTCEQCHEEFSLFPSQITQGGGRFCSRACADLGRRRTVLLICEQCSKEFSLRPSEVMSGMGRFCSRACKHASMQGQLFPHPRHATLPIGSRRLRLDGYIEIKVGTSRASSGWALEHRVIAEQKYGKPIEPGFHIHHLNGDRADNRPENLELVDAGTHGGLSNQQGKLQRQQLRQKLVELEATVKRYQHLYGQLPVLMEVPEVHVCEHCGQSYQPIKPAHVRRSRYCSQQCKMDAMHAKAKEFHAASRPEPIPCQQCGEAFQVPKGRVGEAKYCSKACAADAERTDNPEKPCERCGAMFRARWASETKRNRYCSQRCALRDVTESRLDGYEPPEPQMCAYCAQSYRPRDQATAKTSLYCSRACWRGSRRRPVTLRLVSA